MGAAFLASIVACFLLGGAVAFVPWVSWRQGLQVELGLVVLCALLALGWALQWLGRRRPEDGSWTILLGAFALLLVSLTFFTGEGPGLYPEAVDHSIDLFAWWVAGGGVAAALVAMIFGALGTREQSLLLILAGVLLGCGGLLSLQPMLAAAGQPTVGPLGLGVAVLALAASKLTRRPGSRRS